METSPKKYSQMRTICHTFLVAIFAFLLISCNGDRCKKCRGGAGSFPIPLDKVDNAVLEVSGTLKIYQDNSQIAAITGPEVYINQINTNVENGTWYINFNKCINCGETPEFILAFKDIKSVVLNSDGNIVADSLISIDSIEIRNAGSGNIEFKQLRGAGFRIVNSGSGDIVLKGVSERLSIANSGSGVIRTTEMPADKVEVVNSGSGSCYLTATGTLNVLISGSGNVHYKGAPTITQNIPGSGVLINDN